jgi:hypothetical protein
MSKTNNPHIRKMLEALGVDKSPKSDDALFYIGFAFQLLDSSFEIKSGFKKYTVSAADMENCQKAEESLSEAISALKLIPLEMLAENGFRELVDEKVEHLTKEMEIVRHRLKWLMAHQKPSKGRPKVNSDFEDAVMVLADAYETFTGEKASKGYEDFTSSDTKTVYAGPFYSFCKLALKATGTDGQEVGMQDIIKTTLKERDKDRLDTGGK